MSRRKRLSKNVANSIHYCPQVVVVKSLSVSLLQTLIGGVTIVTTDASIMLAMSISNLPFPHFHFAWNDWISQWRKNQQDTENNLSYITMWFNPWVKFCLQLNHLNNTFFPTISIYPKWGDLLKNCSKKEKLEKYFLLTHRAHLYIFIYAMLYIQVEWLTNMGSTVFASNNCHALIIRSELNDLNKSWWIHLISGHIINKNWINFQRVLGKPNMNESYFCILYTLDIVKCLKELWDTIQFLQTAFTFEHLVPKLKKDPLFYR